jgi:hypothetical protein
MAMATRSVAAKVESVTVKQATVGDLKGQYVLEGLAIVRDEDDTLAQFVTKTQVTLYAFHAMLVGINDEMVREEIAPKARQAALQHLRAPEEATT